VNNSRGHEQTADIRLAFFLNLAFTVLEIVGGLWTNSLAILSDAIHDFGDSISLGLAWYLGRYSERAKDEKYSYGYRRFSLLGALINTVVLIAGSLFVLMEAVPRLLEPEHSNAQGMAVFAVVGIVVNGIAAYRLKGGATLNEQVVAWHLLEDVLGWIAVLIVAITLLFADIHILDPILSILITLYVLYNVLRKIKRTLALFLQAVPEGIDVAAINRRIRGIEQVQFTHHTHVWSLDGEHHVLTTHVGVDECASREDVAAVKGEIRRLGEELGFSHVTIEIEYGDEGCKMAQG
jgi:cobalt-zinc-cadmium efflux system protein